MNEAPIKECPACNKSTLVKKVSGAGFILKGTGWYVTDFKDKNNPEKQSSNISKNDTDTGGDHKSKDNKGEDKKEATQEKSSPAYSNKDSASSSNGTSTNAVKQTSKESGKGVTA